MLSSVVLLLAAVVSSIASDEQLANRDREQFPAEDWHRYYYVTTASAMTETEQQCQEIALNFVIPHLSRNQVLEQHMPVKVGPTLFRLDIGALGWKAAEWQHVVSQYPYTEYVSATTGLPNPLVVRADWLIATTTDAQDNDAYYRLLYGFVPKKRDEVLAVLHVDRTKPELEYGWIEGKSGISVTGTRMLTRYPIASETWAWGSEDVVKLDLESDPLEQPEGDFLHQGEEWIFGLRKISTKTGLQGAVNAYLLSNGQGVVVNRAPVDLVEDHLRFRGLSEVRCAGSCMQCHNRGMLMPTENAWRELLKRGPIAETDYERDGIALEAKLLANVDKELTRDSEDFTAVVEYATGVESDEAVLCYTSVISTYDEPLTLERAAKESDAVAEELRLSLGLGSSYGVRLPARAAALTEGQTMPRDQFEDGGAKAIRHLYRSYRNAQKVE